MFFGLDELWFVSRKKNSRKFFPVHEVLDKIQPDILPALHVSTGFDLTRNVSTKAAALRTAIEGGGELLHAFGWSELTDDMIANAQKFLIRCLSPSNKCIHFDDLRYNAYHRKKFQLDLDLHISRYTWGSMEIWICGRWN